jgi:hypothetical protein
LLTPLLPCPCLLSSLSLLQTLRLRGVANFDSEDLALESADTYHEVEDYVPDFYDEDSSGDLDFIPKRQTIGKNKDKMEGLKNVKSKLISRCVDLLIFVVLIIYIYNLG